MARFSSLGLMCPFVCGAGEECDKDVCGGSSCGCKGGHSFALVGRHNQLGGFLNGLVGGFSGYNMAQTWSVNKVQIQKAQQLDKLEP